MPKRVIRNSVTSGSYAMACNVEQPHSPPALSHTVRYNVHRGNIKPADVTTMLCHDLVASLSPRRLGFSPGLVHVGFVLDEVALRRILLRVLRSYCCEYQCTCAVCLFVCHRHYLFSAIDSVVK